jgi:ribosomal protein S18 acetylase RimI-like enzyme
MIKAPLDNIVWHTLTGPQAQHAVGAEHAKRYAPGFPAFVAFAEPARPDFEAVAAYCRPDEHFYCLGWAGTVPVGWQLEVEKTVLQMVWAGGVPAVDDSLATVSLTAEHAPQIRHLFELTRPGPYAERLVELGRYFGVFDGERLVAMAGERMAAGMLREISGVCTHPDFQGRGLARRLVEKLLRLEIAAGEAPFLHVMADNPHARQVYEGLGFRLHQGLPVRVVSRVVSRVA